MPTNRPQFDAAHPRRGIATLEFAMALPTLLLLMVAITWLGYSVIGQAEVLIVARNNTWKQRFEDKAKAPLMFPSGVGGLTNPFYSAENDYVRETAKKTVDVSPIFKLAPSPEASHTILAGAWDHRAMKLDKPPEFKLMATAAASGKGGTVQSFLTQLNNPIGRFKDAVGNMLAENAKRQTEIADSNAASESGPGGGQAKEAKAENERNREEEKRKYAEKLQKLGGMVNPLNDQVMVTVSGGELDQTIDAIDDLEAKIAAKKNVPVSEDKDQAKKDADELDKQKRELELLKGKRQRIEMDIRDAQAELKALD